MERLIRHLEQLIIQHDYAILPEFGGFIVNYVPAKMEESKNLVSAPHKEIFFNPALNYNDGLLAGFIQRTENITFRRANLIVRDSIENFKKQLKKGETVTLGKIGSLRLDENGQPEFLPADSYDFLPDNIGNYDIRFGTQKPGEEEPRQIVLQLPSNRKRLYKYAAAIGIIVALAILAPVLHPHFSPYLAKLNPLALFAADSLPSFDSLPKRYTEIDSTKVAVGDSLSADSGKHCMATNKCKTPWHIIAGSFPTKNQAIDKARDLQKQVPDKNIAVAYSTVLKKITVPVAAQTNPTVQSIPPKTASWHIVVGNFETAKKAELFASQMKKAHKIQLSVYGTNSVYRIVAASCTTEKEASTKLAEVRKIADFHGAWLLHNATLLSHPNHPAPTTSLPSVTKNSKPAIAITAGPTAIAGNNTPELKPGLWYVIIGNYNIRKQAQEYADATSKREKVVLSIVKDKKFYRVIAGSFNSQQSATAKARELHKHKEFAEAWVLYKPQK
ncbi:MAG: hypothetical protein H6Q17_30 [Bacteroidetes bacterium]|nr:hypothetical protein [Bacteroidota bacterium]